MERTIATTGTTTQWIGTDEAAYRLGVQVQTLYAYVSRGHLSRRIAEDGRRSEFDAAEIDRLASASRRHRPQEIDVVIRTGVTKLTETTLAYRGLNIDNVIREGVSFETQAERLWGTLAESETSEPWPISPGLVDRVIAARSAVAAVPKARPCARLGVATVVLGEVRNEYESKWSESAAKIRLTEEHAARVVSDGKDLLRALPATLIADRDARRLLRSEASIAELVAAAVGLRSASPESVAIIETALVLLADHELAASTFAVRVAASTRASMASALASGFAVMNGSLHGSASAPVVDAFEACLATGRPTEVINRLFERSRRLPGFGHAVYTGEDPRCRLLLDTLRTAAGKRNGGEVVDRGRFHIVERFLEVATERTPVKSNVDFALGALCFCLGLPKHSAEPIFGVARVAGWIAHYLEECAEAPLRFRFRARYDGT